MNRLKNNEIVLSCSPPFFYASVAFVNFHSLDSSVIAHYSLRQLSKCNRRFITDELDELHELAHMDDETVDSHCF